MLCVISFHIYGGVFIVAYDIPFHLPPSVLILPDLVEDCLFYNNLSE